MVQKLEGGGDIKAPKRLLGIGAPKVPSWEEYEEGRLPQTTGGYGGASRALPSGSGFELRKQTKFKV